MKWFPLTKNFFSFVFCYKFWTKISRKTATYFSEKREQLTATNEIRESDKLEKSKQDFAYTSFIRPNLKVTPSSIWHIHGPNQLSIRPCGGKTLDETGESLNKKQRNRRSADWSVLPIRRWNGVAYHKIFFNIRMYIICKLKYVNEWNRSFVPKIYKVEQGCKLVIRLIRITNELPRIYSFSTRIQSKLRSGDNKIKPQVKRRLAMES